jgi:hypothetical protein
MERVNAQRVSDANSREDDETWVAPATIDEAVDKKVAICYLRNMSQPVKLSDGLVLDARLAGEALHRSIAGQVEFWAKLGRAIEPLLQGAQALALCRSADARPLSACIASVDSAAGRRRVRDYLREQPFPHYEPAADTPGLLIRIDADGTRTKGRFVNRVFQPVDAKAKRK